MEVYSTQNEHVMVEELLQFFVDKVDPQLFERVELNVEMFFAKYCSKTYIENFKTSNIQDTDEVFSFDGFGVQCFVAAFNQPFEHTSVQGWKENYSCRCKIDIKLDSAYPWPKPKRPSWLVPNFDPCWPIRYRRGHEVSTKPASTMFIGQIKHSKVLKPSKFLPRWPNRSNEQRWQHLKNKPNIFMMNIIRCISFSFQPSVPSDSACSSRGRCLNFISPMCMIDETNLYKLVFSDGSKPMTSKASWKWKPNFEHSVNARIDDLSVCYEQTHLSQAMFFLIVDTIDGQLSLRAEVVVFQIVGQFHVICIALFINIVVSKFKFLQFLTAQIAQKARHDLVENVVTTFTRSLTYDTWFFEQI